MNSKAAIKKGEEGERQVADLLDISNTFHRLINNLVLTGSNELSHQIDHILINSNGIFVIETKNYYGAINGHEDDSFWTRSYFVRRQKKTVKFHNPLKQNQSHIRAIKRIVGHNYPIYCFVVFTQNNGDVLGLFNVCNLDSLVKRLNLMVNDKPLNKDEIERIYQTLLTNEADVNNEQHISNVKAINQERLEHQKKIRLAIEKRMCPECGNKLLFNNGQLKCPVCKKIIKV